MTRPCRHSRDSPPHLRCTHSIALVTCQLVKTYTTYLSSSSNQLVTSAGHTCLNCLVNRPFLENGPLAVTLGLALEPVTDIPNVDPALFEQLVVDDEVPGRTCCIQSLSVLTLNDPV